jgi:hypothetical protein
VGEAGSVQRHHTRKEISLRPTQKNENLPNEMMKEERALVAAARKTGEW